MKRFNFLPVVVALVLAATFVGCTTMTGVQDEYPDRPLSNRVYVDDPYRGTVVLERDPYTGRYYEVSPYGTYNNRTYRTYGYGNSYGRNDNRRNRNYDRRDRYESRPAPQRPSEDQIRQQRESRDEARKKVLGN